MIGRREFLREASRGLAACGAGALASASARATAGGPATEGSPGGRPGGSLHRALAKIRDDHHLPGLIGAVVRGEAAEAIEVVGVRKVGSPEPMRADDLVHLGSDTKAMTATLIGTLVDQGKLGWSSTIAEVFPGRASAAHPDFRGVTLWDLLTHRAGLPADGPWWRLGRGRSTTDQRRELLTRMLKPAPLSKPGTTFAYSNVGYALAGLMAEQATGRSWETLMRERVFKPLGMASAGFGPPGKPGKVDQPWGHQADGDRFEPSQSDNAPALGPAGTVHCTMRDWARFAALHVQGARGKPRLLAEDTFRKLHTPPKGSEYAGGWLVLRRPWAGGLALTHSGSNTMWYATAWLAPRRDFALLAATNAGGDSATKACDEAIQALIRHEADTRPRGGPAPA